MITETITFKFETEEQQRAFHEELERALGKPVVELWAEQEYVDGVSAGAAARQLCRNLSSNGAYPTLKRMLEDMLSEANREAHIRAKLLDAARLGASALDDLMSPEFEACQALNRAIDAATRKNGN